MDTPQEAKQRCWKAYFIVSLIVSLIIIAVGAAFAVTVIMAEKRRSMQLSMEARNDRAMAQVAERQALDIMEMAAEGKKMLMEARKRIAELETQLENK